MGIGGVKVRESVVRIHLLKGCFSYKENKCEIQDFKDLKISKSHTASLIESMHWTIALNTEKLLFTVD